MGTKAGVTSLTLPPPAKSRLRNCLLPLVFALVALSFLLPFGVLIKSYGFSTEDGSYTVYGTLNGIGDGQNALKDGKSNGQSVHHDQLPSNRVQSRSSHSKSANTTLHSKESSSKQGVAPKVQQVSETTLRNPAKNASDDAYFGKLCQLRFGSYCLWSTENREVLKDPIVTKLKDQLFVARSYYPSISKLKGQKKLALDLKQHIQEYEHMLSEVISDSDLASRVTKKIPKMDQIIARANTSSVDCNNVDKKLRQLVGVTVDEALFRREQSAFLYRLVVHTMPRSLHCLSMRSTVEYFRSRPVDTNHLHVHKFDNPKLRHYIIFSKNIVASSVTINSTVMNSKEIRNIVFHILTNEQNYYAMKLWFRRNSYLNVPIHILSIENLNLKAYYNSRIPQQLMSEEFRVSIHNSYDTSSLNLRTEYVSLFGHTHFHLPKIFQKLKRVVVLDDDVVILRDLSPLWNLDLGGKVNGAVEFCGVRSSQLTSYFGSNNYDKNSCVWMSGLNIVDLEMWRKHDVTRIYLQILHKLHIDSEEKWRIAALPACLLAFDNLIHPLDSSWLISGLGYDYGVSLNAIKHAMALHYNGNMKPWLEFGIRGYKKYWKNFLIQGEKFMEQCNVYS